MCCLFRLFLFTLFFICSAVNAAKEPINLELSVSPALVTYSDALFESPAYAALAFQNSGLPISLSRPIKIISHKILQVGNDRLIFDRKNGNLYQYTASIGLPLGGSISVPVDINVSNLAKGKLTINISTSVAKLVPQELIVRVESKLESLANINAQKKLIDYLALRTKGNLNNPEIKSQLLNQIAFDAINQINILGSGQRVLGDVGQAEPLSGLWPLIIAIAIWSMGLPICLYIIRRHRLKYAVPRKNKQD